jgi:hypothetical protein
LDLVKLTDPTHFGEYLAKKLFEITESLGIILAIFTITWDNALLNNTMLDEFKAKTEESQASKLDWPKQL